MYSPHKNVKIKHLKKLRITIVKNGQPTKRTLQTQCNLTKILRPFLLLEKEKIDLKIHMETQNRKPKKS